FDMWVSHRRLRLEMIREREDGVGGTGGGTAVGADRKPSQVLLAGAFNLPAEFSIIQDSLQGWLDIGRGRCSCHDAGGDERRQVVGKTDDERRDAEHAGVERDRRIDRYDESARAKQ